MSLREVETEGVRLPPAQQAPALALLILGALGVAGLGWFCAVRVAADWSKIALLYVPVVPGLAVAALALRLALRTPIPARAAALVGVAAFSWFAGFAASKGGYRPEGDEPWYLVQADSIIRDHDLRVSPEEVAARSNWYYGAPLPPDQLRVINGRWRTTHWPMLSLLLVPAAWAKSRFLAMLSVAAVVASGMGAAAWSFARITGSTRNGILAAVALLLASPLGEYGLLLFPDGVAAGVWLLALALLLRDEGRSALLAGLVAGALVWIKPSLGFLALAPMAAAHLVAPPSPVRGRVVFVSTVAGCTAAFVAFQLRVYGQVRLYPTPFDLANFPKQLAASIFEPGRGLAIHYPLFGLGALAVMGGALHAARRRALWAPITCLLAGCTVALPSFFAITSGTGGWCPPGRYWTSALPAFTAVGCALWGRSEQRTPKCVQWVGVLLLLWGLGTNVVHLLAPRLAFSSGAHWIAKPTH